MKNLKKKIKLLVWNITPRIYVCKDIYLIMWLGREYYIRRN